MATIDLDITGMTCASCANRIERKLNKIDGVSASVNYATEKAHVDSGDVPVTAADVIATVEKLGYGATVPAPPRAAPPATATRPPAPRTRSSARSASASPAPSCSPCR